MKNIILFIIAIALTASGVAHTISTNDVMGGIELICFLPAFLIVGNMAVNNWSVKSVKIENDG